MSELIKRTRAIQRMVGADPDGIYGPLTAGAIWRELNRLSSDSEAEPPEEEAEHGLDERTLGYIDTLDPKVRENFRHFARLAKATAATLGCDYIMISGNRTWAEQNELYAQGRTKPGKRVTNARGGFSNHNFGIAGDFGVFRNGAYMDNDNPALAAKVHKACSQHAATCGLEWGGSWNSLKDLPHYEIPTGLTSRQKRNVFEKRGSIV